MGPVPKYARLMVLKSVLHATKATRWLDKSATVFLLANHGFLFEIEQRHILEICLHTRKKHADVYLY